MAFSRQFKALLRIAGFFAATWAVVGAVIELGDRLGVPLPATRAMYACAKFLDDARATQRAPRMEVGVR